MAEFLTVQGIPIPVRDRTWKATPVRVGDTRKRLASAGLMDHKQADAWKFAGSTPILDPTEADAVIGLLRGDGHVWSFESSTYSVKGKGFSGTIPTATASFAKFGTKSGEIASGGTSTIAPGYSGKDQTVLVWRRPGAGSFDHYGITRTAGGTVVEVKNGVAGSFTTSNWLTFGAAAISLLGKNDAGANTIVQADDFVVLPYLLTTAQIAAVYTASTPWILPWLRLGGDGVAVAKTDLDALGELGVVTPVQAYSPLSGAWKQNNVEVAIGFETAGQ